MSSKALLLASVLVAALLAGCSSKPPTGTAADLSYSPATLLKGDAILHYQAASGANPTSGLPGVGNQFECSQPGAAGPVMAPCKPAFTDLKVNITAPKAGDGKYAVYLLNATGEVKVTELTETLLPTGPAARYTGGKNFTTDLKDRYTSIELRLDNFVYASGPVAEGPNPFALAATASLVKVEGFTIEGHKLTGTISGLPANSTYLGNLYLAGADGKALSDPEESFSISGNGPFDYTSTNHDLVDFAEFHVHVDHSKLNLYKASIKKTE